MIIIPGYYWPATAHRIATLLRHSLFQTRDGKNKNENKIKTRETDLIARTFRTLSGTGCGRRVSLAYHIHTIATAILHNPDFRRRLHLHGPGENLEFDFYNKINAP
jgi:hypothetical protein